MFAAREWTNGERRLSPALYPCPLVCLDRPKDPGKMAQLHTTSLAATNVAAIVGENANGILNVPLPLGQAGDPSA